MNITISKSKIHGKIAIPGSKSHTVRAIAIALMAEGISTIINPLKSDDTLSCLRATEKLGSRVAEEHQNGTLIWKISGTGGLLTNTNDEIINLNNSGTSLRILAGLAATCNLKTRFDGDTSLRGRPMGHLLSALEKLGAEVHSSEGGKCPFAVRGPLKGGETTINGESSQFVTSLLFATPLALNDTEINVVNINEEPYIDMTLDWLDLLKMEYSSKPDYSQFIVKGKQKYSSFEKTIPADFSTATFALAAAAVSGNELKICGLDFSDKQGDKEVFNYLKDMGMCVERHDDYVIVSRKGKLNGNIEIDLNATPDALPAMAVVASYATGKTILNNVPHARIKETDRISAMAKELKKMEADVEELPDGLIIKESKLKGTTVNGYNDHRMIMALTIAGIGASGETTINNADAVSVTYPNFIEDFQNIGAKIKTTN